MKEEWLFPAALIPVDRETTHALVAEIKRLIDVVGGMALAQQEGMEAGRLVEREACAKVCESLWRIDGQFTADEFASEVRARGDA